MHTSIIIPVFNNYFYTKKCIFSLHRHKTLIDYEIIIVDNNSTDQTTTLLSSLASNNLKIIKNPINFGFAKACNQAAKIANNDHLVFLNNDTEVTPGWIEGLSRCMFTDESIGVVGCKLLYPDRSIQHAGVAFSSAKVHHLYRNFHLNHPAANKFRELQAVTAACMLVSRGLFLSLGGFDEDFINGFEDLDFCFRARKTGIKVMYTPESVVIHHESKTPGRHDHHGHNASLFASRWLPSVVHDLDTIYAQDGLSRHQEYENKFGGKWLIDSNANHFWDKARTFAKRSSYQEAENYFAKALSFNPYDVRRLTIAEELSDLYTRWGRLADAISCLDSIIQVRPSQRVLEKKARIATLAQSHSQGHSLI